MAHHLTKALYIGFSFNCSHLCIYMCILKCNKFFKVLPFSWKLPETWSMFLEESTVHRLTLYPDEEGSGGKKVYFWAYSSCESKMGKHSCAHLQCTVKSIKSLNHRLTAPCTTTFNPRLYYSHLSSPPCCAHFFFSIPTAHFQTLLTSTVWGGSWSHLDSSPVWGAEGCCFPHPRWLQMSRRLYKESLL